MLRLQKKDPQFALGIWNWDEAAEKLNFRAFGARQMNDQQYIITGGFKFRRSMDQTLDMIFRQQFCRDRTTYDYDVILVQDIKNVVLFLAPPEMINKRFVHFVHTEVYHSFIHALIIYFEHFLKMLEFVLIRRDDTTASGLQQTEQSTIMKRVWSAQLSQYRLMVAREYQFIVLGEGEMAPYYHILPATKISQTDRDMVFHEHFLAFSTQVVWIAMHRRALEEITGEIERLFRSELFMTKPSPYTRTEASMLYGKFYTPVVRQSSRSPLITELEKVEPQNKPLLTIGYHKYRGTDERVLQMELEFIVPESQLVLIDLTHGILGHPRKIYDSLLRINWLEFRKQNYNEKYDPYRILRQPQLELPKNDTEQLRQHAETYNSHFEIKHHSEEVSKETLDKWVRRDEIIANCKDKGVLTTTWTICQAEAESRDYGKTTDDIAKEYLVSKHKLRKN